MSVGQHKQQSLSAHGRKGAHGYALAQGLHHDDRGGKGVVEAGAHEELVPEAGRHVDGDCDEVGHAETCAHCLAQLDRFGQHFRYFTTHGRTHHTEGRKYVRDL